MTNFNRRTVRGAGAGHRQAELSDESAGPEAKPRYSNWLCCNFESDLLLAALTGAVLGLEEKESPESTDNQDNSRGEKERHFPSA